MSTVRVTIQGNVPDYEAFSSFAKKMCEYVDAQEPGALAYEWFADQEAGRALIHEIYQDADAFVTHVQGATERGDMDTFMSVMEIDQVTMLNRVGDPRVAEIGKQFNATMLHGVAGVTR